MFSLPLFNPTAVHIFVIQKKCSFQCRLAAPSDWDQYFQTKPVILHIDI